MRCDDIREQFVGLLYNEGGTPPANIEIENHLQTCSACRQEFEDLKKTRGYLRAWKDESPLRSVSIVGCEPPMNRNGGWKYLRYAAIAAMALVCIMALANTQISLNKNGFSISTHLFKTDSAERDYYTKGEMRDLMKRALEDSEGRMNELNYLMINRMLDTVEQERWIDLHLISNRATSNSRNRN